MNVIVATPDKEILDLVEKNSGKAILTSKDHSTGTDRVYEALEKISNDEINIDNKFTRRYAKFRS